MSSFSKPGRSDQRLYTLSRRELQALCKQHGIPTNNRTSDGAMVEALSACVPVDFGKPKAHSSRAETPSGKRKLSPREEGSSLKSSMTPSRRGMKRPERPPREENSSRDRFGKAVAATSRPTPGKRAGVTRRGEAVQPVACTEIEFRNAALHKELFGGHTDFPPVVDRGPFPTSESVVETGFEFRDMALHKDLFGSSTAFISPLTSSSPEVLDYSGHEIRVLSSIREEDDSPACALSRMEDDNSPATPLTKLQSNLSCTLTKATSILEKLAAMRVDAEKKRREGYYEMPKFTSPVFQKALVVDRDLPSAKKARLTPKAISNSDTEMVLYETPAKTFCFPDGSDKENQHWKSRKIPGSLGKEKKEVLRDRSKNVNNEPELRPEEMSLRKLRAQFKERIRQLEASKASDLRPWSERLAEW